MTKDGRLLKVLKAQLEQLTLLLMKKMAITLD